MQPHFTLELFDFLLEDLKRKDHVAMFPFTEAEITEAGFMESFTDACCKSSPYMHFLTTAVGLPY